MRSGIIAKKVGMTRLFMEDGKQIPVTVLQMENLQVVAQRSSDQHGYTAVQLGAGSAKAKNTSKAMRGHFAVAKVEPKRKVAEFRVDPENMLDVGSELTAEHYVEGQFVDVSGTSIGKGFAGAMKRHNFGGLRASHGFQSATVAWFNCVKAQVKCSKARKWQATWVPFVLQHKTYRLLKQTQIVV